MSINIVAWNTQGLKWDEIKVILPTILTSGRIPDLVYLCETGVMVDNQPLSNVGIIIPETTVIVMDAPFKYHGVWVRWCMKDDGTGNPRCSVAMLEFTSGDFNWDINFIKSNVGGTKRPVVFAENRGTKKRVYGIHTISNSFASPGELSGFADDCCNDAPDSWLAVGDMNFDLRNDLTNAPITVPGLNVGYVFSGEPTHRNGSQLDWGFGYGLGNPLLVTKVLGVTTTKDGLTYLGSPGLLKSPSDHAALYYQVDFK